MAYFSIHRNNMKKVEKKLAALNRRGSRIGGYILDILATFFHGSGY